LEYLVNPDCSVHDLLVSQTFLNINCGMETL